MFGFLSGLSMFSPTVALISIAAHSSAAVALAYFALDVWDCNLVSTRINARHKKKLLKEKPIRN